MTPLHSFWCAECKQHLPITELESVDPETGEQLCVGCANPYDELTEEDYPSDTDQ